MPRFNGTGPAGAGKLTGRGMGLCNETNAVLSQGTFRRGCGRGFGRGFAYQAPSQEDLISEKEALQKRINEIDKTLE